MLTGLLNFFFRTGIRDADCGMRAFRRETLPRLSLRTTGTEFASETVIRAAKERLAIEQPRSSTTASGLIEALELQGRLATPALPARAQSDLPVRTPGPVPIRGGRDLVADRAGPRVGPGRTWDLHTLIAGSLLEIIGTQAIGLGLCAHAYGTYFTSEHQR